MNEKSSRLGILEFDIGKIAYNLSPLYIKPQTKFEIHSLEPTFVWRILLSIRPYTDKRLSPIIQQINIE